MIAMTGRVKWESDVDDDDNNDSDDDDNNDRKGQTSEWW